MIPQPCLRFLAGLVCSLVCASALGGSELWVVQDRDWRPARVGKGASGAGLRTSHAALEVGRMGMAVERRVDALGAVVVRMPPDARLARGRLQALVDRGLRVAPVVGIEPAEVYPADPFFSNQWHLNNTGQSGGLAGFDIRAVRGWERTTGSVSTVIAITDSGVQGDHIDLAGRMWVNEGEIPGNGLDDDGNGYVDDVYGWNSALNGPGPLADPAIAAHGTAVAGTAAAMTGNGIGTAGVDWGARIMPVVIFDGNYVGTDVSASEGIIYAVRAGADIINASWGSRDASLLLDAAVEFAAANGVVIVAAAGNDGLSADRHPFFPAAIRNDYLVSVGGANRSGGWSHNFGVRTVTVTAPSVSIFQPRINNQFGFGSGTSYAAPQVSGILGLLRGQNPGLSMAQLHHRLKANGRVFPGLVERNPTDSLVSIEDALAVEADGIPPARIEDLEVQRVGFNGVVLGWTAVGDDGGVGRAAGYSVRISDRELTDAEFQAHSGPALHVVPSNPGQQMWVVVTGLLPGVEYVAQVRAEDEAGNLGLVSPGVTFTTNGYPGLVSFDPCDGTTSTWTGSGGMALAPGNAITGSLTWQDSPGTNYVPGTTAALTLAEAVDLSAAKAPALLFWHRRQFPNNERFDALVVDLIRQGETTATRLAVLGGTSSPTKLEVVPVPTSMTTSGPVRFRFSIVSDGGPLVASGIELDDLAIVDQSAWGAWPESGEWILEPRSWTGELTPGAELSEADWQPVEQTNLAPGAEGRNTYQAMAAPGSGGVMGWSPLVTLPGRYEVAVSWPSGQTAEGIGLRVLGTGVNHEFQYDQIQGLSHRWNHLGFVDIPLYNGPEALRVEVRGDGAGASGIILAPAVRMRWISPLQVSTEASHLWLSTE